ncbi:MAG: hypothetical protein LC127_14265, partial [Chitinophagales bacterium]|nr:hypothetical protein [Chitinophagales bacterium]
RALRCIDSTATIEYKYAPKTQDMKEVLTLLGFVCLCIVCIVLWIAVNFSTSMVIFMIGGFVLIAAYCGTDSSD